MAVARGRGPTRLAAAVCRVLAPVHESAGLPLTRSRGITRRIFRCRLRQRSSWGNGPRQIWTHSFPDNAGGELLLAESCVPKKTGEITRAFLLNLVAGARNPLNLEFCCAAA